MSESEAEHGILSSFPFFCFRGCRFPLELATDGEARCEYHEGSQKAVMVVILGFLIVLFGMDFFEARSKKNKNV